MNLWPGRYCSGLVSVKNSYIISAQFTTTPPFLISVFFFCFFFTLASEDTHWSNLLLITARRTFAPCGQVNTWASPIMALDAG